MALKADRVLNHVDLSFFAGNVSERGAIAVINGSGGSGAAMDQSAATVLTTGTSVSGAVYIAGLLLNDVVNLDLTRQHLNQHKDEVQVNSKCALLRKGVVVTNLIDTGAGGTPTALIPAYLATNASVVGASTTYTNLYVLGTANPDTAGSQATKRVGTWLSQKDSDGYAKVEINL